VTKVGLVFNAPPESRDVGEVALGGSRTTAAVESDHLTHRIGFTYFKQNLL
jgi:hypothetical protein